jgi:hypothetical protein
MEKSIDIGKAFRHLFDDPDWKTKMLLGALLVIVPILNFVVMGYEVRVIRNVSKGEGRPMPAWDDFGGLFSDGLQLGLARLVYILPTLIFILPFFFLFFLPILLAIVTGGDSDALDRLFGAALGIGFLIAFAGFGLTMIYSVLVGLLMPAVTAHFVKRNTFAACFELRAIFDFIRRDVSTYLTVWVASLLAGLAVAGVYMVVNFIPCIGSLFAIPVSMAGGFFIFMVNGHAIGQALALESSTGGQHELSTT